MDHKSPFLNVSSFVIKEANEDIDRFSASSSSPFLSLYESNEGGELIDRETEEKVEFLNELYNEEFDEALFGLVNEAAALYETRFVNELANPSANGQEAERFLHQHFAPLVAEAQEMLGALANELSQRDPNSLTMNEIENIVERYQPSIELTPSFEEFFGKLKKLVKKVAGKALTLAKSGISAAAKLGLGPLLKKLEPLIKPIITRVIQTAIGKLPAQLQPIARKLAERLPFLKEFDESSDYESHKVDTCKVCSIQHEFNNRVANILFAPTVVEQDLEIAHVLTEQQGADTNPLAGLDQARNEFVDNLGRLKEGEDPTPHVQDFIPAILPVLQVAMKLGGRKPVVNFLAKLMGRLIQKFVGPQYAPALSIAIVDAGLRLINLEATPEDESRAAASAVAATVEETVRRVAALPDYVLDDQEVLEGFVLEAFEHAAAANLPQILSEEAYRKRPDLVEAKNIRGTWIMLPPGGRKRYKKFSRGIPIRLIPHNVSAVETFEGTTLEQFLEEEIGVAPGDEVEATVHLYESIPGTHLPDLVRYEQSTLGLGAPSGYQQLHPLTREAAGLLVGEPSLGREANSQYSLDPHSTVAGERFYYLEIPGKRPLTIPGVAGRPNNRRSTRVKLTLDFPKNEIRVYLFLSEIRAQEIAVKLRQHAHIGVVTTRLQGIIQRGLGRALTGGRGRLKIVHEAVAPEQWASAMRRLPSIVLQGLLGRIQEWILKGLSDQLKQQTQDFIKASEDTADGVTLVFILGNPPGFSQLRLALKGKGISLASMKMSDGAPTVQIKFGPGYVNE